MIEIAPKRISQTFKSSQKQRMVHDKRTDHRGKLVLETFAICINRFTDSGNFSLEYVVSKRDAQDTRRTVPVCLIPHHRVPSFVELTSP
jgi:hypothetical protein